MIELVRNCSHGSEIATYLETYESGKKKIIKSATDREGIKNIINEVKGWNWYQKERYPKTVAPFCRILKHNECYIKIEIKYIHGKKMDYGKGLIKNANFMAQIIKHYIEIWPRAHSYNVPLHGDMSIDNIIYNADGIHIFDWEHFSEEGAPWGFDPVYLLFESLWFGMRKRKEPALKEIEVIGENLRLLYETACLQNSLIRSPLRFLREFINDNATIWGEQLKNFADKLPIFKFNEEQVSLIDKLISKVL